MNEGQLYRPSSASIRGAVQRRGRLFCVQDTTRRLPASLLCNVTNGCQRARTRTPGDPGPYWPRRNGGARDLAGRVKIAKPPTERRGLSCLGEVSANKR